jgi:hypothetical protein
MTAPAETGGKQGVDPPHPREAIRLPGEPGSPEVDQRLQLLGRRDRAAGDSFSLVRSPVRWPA